MIYFVLVIDKITQNQKLAWFYMLEHKLLWTTHPKSDKQVKLTE